MRTAALIAAFTLSTLGSAHAAESAPKGQGHSQQTTQETQQTYLVRYHLTRLDQTVEGPIHVCAVGDKATQILGDIHSSGSAWTAWTMGPCDGTPADPNICSAVVTHDGVVPTVTTAGSCASTTFQPKYATPITAPITTDTVKSGTAPERVAIGIAVGAALTGIAVHASVNALGSAMDQLGNRIGGAGPICDRTACGFPLSL